MVSYIFFKCSPENIKEVVINNLKTAEVAAFKKPFYKILTLKNSGIYIMVYVAFKYLKIVIEIMTSLCKLLLNV